METYDIVMLIVLVAASVFGAWKGLAWQIAMLASIFLSYFVAYRFREPVGSLISSTAPWNNFLAMLILYIATSLAIWLAFGLISGFIDRLKLKEFDRQIGALLGFATGGLLCVVITLFSVTLSGEEMKSSICKSRSGYYIALALDKADAVMPSEVHEMVGPYLHSLDGKFGHSVGEELGHSVGEELGHSVGKELGRSVGEELGRSLDEIREQRPWENEFGPAPASIP